MPKATFHPDLADAARWLPRGGFGRRSLPVIRALTKLSERRSEGSTGGVEVHRLDFGVTVRLHGQQGPASRRPAILWIHGGGFVMGTAAQDDRLCRRLASALGAVVAAVDYRLAPEHRYPTPLDDCYAALQWLSRRDDVDPGRVAVAGASAGGGLAAGLAQLATDRGEISLAAQVLAYPMLDDRTAVRTGVDQSGFRLWNNKSNRFGWKSYTGAEPGSDRIPELAAPARRRDLTGLPPAWIGVGTLDLFHDEDVAYAERLREAGVACRLEVVEGAYHGFDAVRPDSGVSRAFFDSQVEALRAAFG